MCVCVCEDDVGVGLNGDTKITLACFTLLVADKRKRDGEGVERGREG